MEANNRDQHSKKTYHVALQFESVVFKGKALLNNVAALDESMIMAELDDLLLTAGHDRRPQIMPETSSADFIVYAPPPAVVAVSHVIPPPSPEAA